MKINIDWRPCDDSHIPESGRLVLFMRKTRDAGEVITWDRDASWASWNPQIEERWCYVDDLAS